MILENLCNSCYRINLSGGGEVDVSGKQFSNIGIWRQRRSKIEFDKFCNAGCIAFTQFRMVSYGALIYGGDDLSGREWSEKRGGAAQREFGLI